MQDYEQSLAIERSIGYWLGGAYDLLNMAIPAPRRGEPARARALLRESLSLRSQAGGPLGIARIMGELAMTEADEQPSLRGCRDWR